MDINLLSNTEIEQLCKLIGKSKNIVACCHVNPDGDAIGSLLGMSELLRTQGKLSLLVVPDAFPDFLQWMPGTERIVRYDHHKDFVNEEIEKADLIFCLDFNTMSRTGDMEEAMNSSNATKVLIDHHPQPDINASLCVSHPEACSTCELVFRIAWQLDCFKLMTHKFAAPIYCGMMTDTGGFTYNSTRPEIFFIISQLLTKKINKDKIYRNVFNNYSEYRLRLMGYILYEKLVVIPEKHASYFILTRADMKRFHFIKGDAEGLVNIPLQIKGQRLSIYLREDSEKDNKIWVSLRSVDDFPCNVLAQRYFNGGGHLNASGGHLECSIEEAESIVRKAIYELRS